MSDENNNENQEEKLFPLEKILTISAKDYCNIYSKKLKDYTAVGINIDTVDKFGASLIPYFRKQIPENTEIVVNFQHSVGGVSASSRNYLMQYASGTALIRKEEKKE